MNKAELIDIVAAELGETKASVARQLDVTIKALSTALKKGDDITLVGFGSFRVAKRAPRKGVNPHTGEPMKIAAAKVARFRPGMALRNLVNGKSAAKSAAKAAKPAAKSAAKPAAKVSKAK